MTENEDAMSATSDDAASVEPEAAGSPVFVDASGRRARRIERLAALVVLICMGYGLALLIAAVTGVPIQGAVVPYPDLGSSPHSSAPARAPNGPTSVNGSNVPSGSPTASPTPAATPSASPVGSHPTVTTTPTARPTRTTRPTGKPTATATHGSSASAPGATHRPTARPTVAHTHSAPRHP